MRYAVRFPAATLAVLLSGLGACASSPGPVPEVRAAELLSSRPAPPGRNCTIIPTPAELPPPELLVDTAALVADLGDLPDLRATEPDSAAYVLLSMGYDLFGANVRRAVIEHNLPAVVADSVQRLVFAHRRTLPESEGNWGVRLRIELEEPVRFEVGRQEYCAPRPRDINLALAMESTIGTGTRIRAGHRESTVWVRLVVSPRGTVTDVAVERGIVAGIGTEQRILDFVRTLYFDAALADGLPVTGTVSIPVVVRERT